LSGPGHPVDADGPRRRQPRSGDDPQGAGRSGRVVPGGACQAAAGGVRQQWYLPGGRGALPQAARGVCGPGAGGGFARGDDPVPADAERGRRRRAGSGRGLRRLPDLCARLPAGRTGRSAGFRRRGRNRRCGRIEPTICQGCQDASAVGRRHQLLLSSPPGGGQVLALFQEEQPAHQGVP
jgi:hypothetical protein